MKTTLSLKVLVPSGGYLSGKGGRGYGSLQGVRTVGSIQGRWKGYHNATDAVKLFVF